MSEVRSGSCGVPLVRSVIIDLAVPGHDDLTEGQDVQKRIMIFGEE